MKATHNPNAARIPAGVWMLGLVSLLMDVASEMIHSLLPLFMVSGLGASALAVGWIEGLAESTALLVRVFSGLFSDYLGKRKELALIGYGLGALAKPLFAVSQSVGMVLTARVIDRIGKGIRGTPRDALVADLTPPPLRGAAYGLRQALDTVGACLGPLLAFGLMLLWDNDFRSVFWVAMIPGLLSCLVLWRGVQEPKAANHAALRSNPVSRANLSRLSQDYWWVVAIGWLVSLARFSEAFLLLRAQEAGFTLSTIPLVMVLMNLAYSATAFPFGKLADRMSMTRLLSSSLLVLMLADWLLALPANAPTLLAGVALWGIHLGMSQGLLSKMVADTAPTDLRGTAFGYFNLASGIALLLASTLAGWVWDRLGAEYSFYFGAGFCGLALLGLLIQPKPVRQAT